MYSLLQNDGNTEYQVVWKQNSWVSEAELTLCKDVLEEFKSKGSPINELCNALPKVSLNDNVKGMKTCQQQLKKSTNDFKQGKIANKRVYFTGNFNLHSSSIKHPCKFHSYNFCRPSYMMLELSMN